MADRPLREPIIIMADRPLREPIIISAIQVNRVVPIQ